jgi:hypothetical protein
MDADPGHDGRALMAETKARWLGTVPTRCYGRSRPGPAWAKYTGTAATAPRP